MRLVKVWSPWEHYRLKILDSIVAEAAAASEPGAAAQVNITLVFHFLIKSNKMSSEHPSLDNHDLFKPLAQDCLPSEVALGSLFSLALD